MKKLRIDNSQLTILAAIIVFIFSIVHFSLSITPTFAQNPPVDLTALFEVADNEAVDGDILIYDPNGIIRANITYSNKIFGVLQEKPLVIYRQENSTGKPVVRAGVAQVNVTNGNGAIKPGDYITSSKTPGKGQKADQSGYVLGVALSGMDQESEKIPVAIRIEYAELTNTRSVLRLLDYFNITAFQSTDDPEKGALLIKYSVSGLLLIIALIFSIMVFARSISKGIEALGRNPLAKSAIQLSIIINALLTIVIILIAVGTAFVILKL